MASGGSSQDINELVDMKNLRGERRQHSADVASLWISFWTEPAGVVVTLDHGVRAHCLRRRQPPGDGLLDGALSRFELLNATIERAVRRLDQRPCLCGRKVDLLIERRRDDVELFVD